MASTTTSSSPISAPEPSLQLKVVPASPTPNQVLQPDPKNPRVAPANDPGSEESELEDLETSLLALEKLDRASPDLWPDHIPGVSQFIPLATPQDSPAVNQQNNLEGLTQDDFATIHQLSNLPVDTLLNEVKRLHDAAYELGIEERKEMTRGKYLNIFRARN